VCGNTEKLGANPLPFTGEFEVVFETLQNNLSQLDFSLLLPDIMTIADEVDSQLTQAMDSYTNVAQKPAAQLLAPRMWIPFRREFRDKFLKEEIRELFVRRARNAHWKSCWPTCRFAMQGSDGCLYVRR
jgi:hypothetical protein